MKKIISLILVTAFILLLCACGNNAGTSDNTETSTAAVTALSDTVTTNAGDRIRIDDGVFITGVDSYSGPFSEDGSDATVNNVVRITVENSGEHDIQLLDITAKDTLGRELTFEITTLPVGSKVTCLEMKAAQYEDKLKLTSAKASQIAYFTYKLSLNPETLLFMCSDNCIEVKNVSDKAYAGGSLHYKSTEGEILSGGITYSLTIPAIAPGQSTTLSSKHFLSGKSRILFVTNAE